MSMQLAILIYFRKNLKLIFDNYYVPTPTSVIIQMLYRKHPKTIIEAKNECTTLSQINRKARKRF